MVWPSLSSLPNSANTANPLALGVAKVTYNKDVPTYHHHSNSGGKLSGRAKGEFSIVIWQILQGPGLSGNCYWDGGWGWGDIPVP